MADPRVRIIVEAVTDAAERQMRKLQGTVEDVGKETSKSGRLFDGFTSALAGIGIAVGAATTAFYAFKKAYDFGKEGAAIAQTTESFDRLMASMGVAPSILQQMRDASLGTVDDMTLMSSTMTLLAGTSDELGRRMAESAPQLLEIAKAAHKLNPRLGDTAFLYESLARGIKRSSPLILDNLGLVIKVGEANEKWADKMGISVEAMTAEEKQMALLDAALEAGDRMIQQVGGSTEEMGDSFAQAEVQIKNASDTLKSQLAPVMADVVDALADSVALLLDQEGVYKRVSQVAYDSADNYQDYAEALIEAGQASGILADIDAERIRNYIKGTAEASDRTQSFIRDLGLMTEAQWENNRAFDTLTGGMENFTHALDPWIERQREAALAAEEHAAQLESTSEWFYKATDAGYTAQSMLEGMVGKAEAAAAAERNAAQASDEFTASMALLDAAIRGEAGAAIDEYQGKMAELDAALAAGEMSQAEYNAALDEATASYYENTNALIYNIAQKQILDALEKGLIEDVNASGTAYDEATAALWATAEAMGMVDESTVALMESVQEQTGAFIEGKTTADGLASNLSGLAGAAADAASQGIALKSAIDGLHDKQITITTTYVTKGHESDDWQGGYQHGGQFMVRGPGGADNVPVNFRATAGEIVTITPPGATPPANPNPVNNYNLTINTSAQAESALADFRIMRALAGAS